MVFADEFLYIHGSSTHLLSVHVADQGLLVSDIFFAHAASLRQTFYFARWGFSGVYSQLLYLCVRVGQRENGGEGGIRTHGRISPTHAFQACSLNRSDTSPQTSREATLINLAESRWQRTARINHCERNRPHELSESRIPCDFFLVPSHRALLTAGALC
jgi:hypothetical protein